jgi:hypothetical protein
MTRNAAEDPRAWQDFERLVAKLAACDDGWIAEMLSETTIKMLMHRWDGAPAYLDGTAAPWFREFVVRHVDATLAMEDLAVVERNAARRCKQAHRVFCTRVAQAAREARAALREVVRGRDGGT